MKIKEQIEFLIAECNLLLEHFSAFENVIAEQLNRIKKELRALDNFQPAEVLTNTVMKISQKLIEIESNIVNQKKYQVANIDSLLQNLSDLRKQMLKNIENGTDEDQEIKQYHKLTGSIYDNLRKNINGFQVIPFDITRLIFNYLDADSLWALSREGKVTRDLLEKHSVTNIYYAVGDAINLEPTTSEYRLNSYQEVCVASFEDRIYGSLSYTYKGTRIRLFDNIEAARKCKYFHSPATYNQRTDLMDAYETPAIFVVELKKGINIVNHNLNVSEYWMPDSPGFPPLKRAIIPCLKPPVLT